MYILINAFVLINIYLLDIHNDIFIAFCRWYLSIQLTSINIKQYVGIVYEIPGVRYTI